MKKTINLGILIGKLDCLALEQSSRYLMITGVTFQKKSICILIISSRKLEVETFLVVSSKQEDSLSLSLSLSNFSFSLLILRRQLVKLVATFFQEYERSNEKF
jgi:hypothetical protein